MKTVTVEKVRLLETLEENRKTHNADFDIAWEKFRERVIQNFEARLDAAKNLKKGQQIELWVNLDIPVNHDDDYERAIQMLDWETGNEVELSQSEFSNYVQDDWAWTATFSASNMAYTGSASPSRGR